MLFLRLLQDTSEESQRFNTQERYRKNDTKEEELGRRRTPLSSLLKIVYFHDGWPIVDPQPYDVSECVCVLGTACGVLLNDVLNKSYYFTHCWPVMQLQTWHRSLSQESRADLDTSLECLVRGFVVGGSFTFRQLKAGAALSPAIVTYSIAVAGNSDMFLVRLGGISLVVAGFQNAFMATGTEFKTASCLVAIVGGLMYLVPNMLKRSNFLDEPDVRRLGPAFGLLSANEELLYHYLLQEWWNAEKNVPEAAQFVFCISADCDAVFFS
jgi:hypothetical protein